LAAGSNINNLKNEHFAAIEVPLAPLSEQERIVVKLERLLAKVGQCHLRVEKIFKFLKRFRQSVLSAACSGRLTADWREEHIGECLVSSKQASSRSNSQIEEIVDTPDEWTWVTLDFLCNPNRSICYGVIKLGIEHDQGVPCLRTSDVKPLRIDTVGVKRIDPLISNQFGRTVLRGGEVLVNVRGTLGGVAVVPPELNGWNISREVAVVPVVDADHEFIAFWIASLSAQGWLTSVVKGVAYSGINIEDLRQLPVALPSLTEQEEIVRRVKNLLALADKIEGRYMTVQRQVDSLPQSILAKAFRGELVPTEAELAEREGRPYESAEQLLRRIRVSTEGFNHSISRKDSRRRDNVAR
jgi:type I restriction enzyme S subunit